MARRKPSRISTGRLKLLRLFSTLLAISLVDELWSARSEFNSLFQVTSEDSSGDRRRLGHISKQGNTLLRFLLVEAAQVTVRSLPEWRSKYFHLALRRGRKIAKVAMARKLAIQADSAIDAEG